MSDATVKPKRDLAWKRDGRAKGVYWRKLAKGKGWGYYAAGKIHAAPSRAAAIEGKAKATLRKSAGLPEPDTRVTIATLAEEVRAAKRGKLAKPIQSAAHWPLASLSQAALRPSPYCHVASRGCSSSVMSTLRALDLIVLALKP